MKILHIHTGLSLMGGAESLIINLANEQSKNNDVKVCSIFKPSKDGIFYTRLSNNIKKEHLKATNNGFSLRNLWKVFKYIYNTDAQIIHIHGFFYYYALPILLLHKDCKFVYTVHSDAFKENSKWDKRILWLKRFCFKHKWLNAVTISKESDESFYKLYGVNAQLIFNGVPHPHFDNKPNIIDEMMISPKTKIFCHPARISPEKNQIVLCRVFSRLIKEGEDVSLMIVGTKQVQEVYDKLKPFFSNRIKYLGERNDIPQLLSRSYGFCLPSIWEGLPLTLLEALSVGCIPICSPVGGIVGVIENEVNGMLSKSSSEEDYYHCMKKILSFNDIKIASMRHMALKSFNSYDITNTAKNYCCFYSKLLEK